MPGGKVPEIGQVVKNAGWANTMERLVKAEKDDAGKGSERRHSGLMAVRDCFYKGEIAEEIVKFQKERDHWVITIQFHIKIIKNMRHYVIIVQRQNGNQ